jgi:hypothetical protein
VDVGVNGPGLPKADIDLGPLLKKEYNASSTMVMNFRGCSATMLLTEAVTRAGDDDTAVLSVVEDAWLGCLLGKHLVFDWLDANGDTLTFLSLGFHGWGLLGWVFR